MAATAAAAALPGEPLLPSSRLRTRLRMYSMMFGSTLTIKTVRYAIPMIAPCAQPPQPTH
jgi:hypothetical protein